jgi:hypothetical protein
VVVKSAAATDLVPRSSVWFRPNTEKGIGANHFSGSLFLQRLFLQQ